MAALKYRSILLNATDWTPIAAPFDCSYMSVWNTPGGWFGVGAQAVTLRTDQTDEKSGKPLAVGAQELIVSPPPPALGQRFKKGENVLWAKADYATSEIIVTFLT